MDRDERNVLVAASCWCLFVALGFFLLIVNDTNAGLPPNTVSCESTCADGRAILHYQCASGPVLCECVCPAKADSDGDGDVDLADYGWFQRRFGAK